MEKTRKDGGNRSADWRKKIEARKVVQILRQKDTEYVCLLLGTILASRLKFWLKGFPKRNRDWLLTHSLQDLLFYYISYNIDDCGWVSGRMVPNKGSSKKTRRKQSQASKARLDNSLLHPKKRVSTQNKKDKGKV